jgi:hypothetical protein
MASKSKRAFLIFGILAGVMTACLGLETRHNNHLGWALLFSGTSFTVVGSIYLGALTMQTERVKQPGNHFLWLPSFAVFIISLVTPLEYLFLPELLPRSDQLQDIGLILFAGGLAFYLVSLCANNTGPISSEQTGVNPSHRDKMILQTILCPLSASVLLTGFGMGIGYSSLIGLLVIVLVVVPALLIWKNAINH